jgi:prophage regulatory protein
VPERIFRRKKVEELVGLGRSAIYAAMAAGEFPRPIRLGKRAVGWKESAIEEWITSREKSSREE